MRRRSRVQSSPRQTGRVRGQTTQSLWRITCPPPEQTPRTCREDPLGQKKRASAEPSSTTAQTKHLSDKLLAPITIHTVFLFTTNYYTYNYILLFSTIIHITNKVHPIRSSTSNHTYAHRRHTPQLIFIHIHQLFRIQYTLI